MLKRILKNKIFIYVASRYGTYAIQFVVSMAIAARLGPYYLGIYGFVLLIISYFSQANFGIPHSLNVLMVHNKDNRELCGTYIGNSLFLYGILSLFVFFLYAIVEFYDIQIDKRYPIDNYLFLIASIAILTYINAILTAILRFRNKVNQLSIVQSINVILNLLVVFFFEGSALVMALIICNMLACIITSIISLKSQILPKINDIKLSVSIQKEILHKGIFLFLYNSCFYLILITIRSIISSNYTVEEFGAFTFSFTIANSVMLLLESIMTIVFPKIIDLFSTDDHERIERALENMRVGYISLSHFLIYLAMILFPVLVFYLPKYSNAITSMNMIALAVLIGTNACGYSSFLIAKNKEKISALISLSALFINILLGLVFALVVKVSFSYVIIATLITYLYYSFMCVLIGRRILGVVSITYTIKNFFPIRLLIPYTVAFVISCVRAEYIIWVPFVLYIALNRQDIMSIKIMAMKLIKNPSIADV